MFLPTTPEECRKLGWNRLDIIIVTGDAYIDSPYIGAAVIGKVLLDAGYRVGIIAQPVIQKMDDMMRLGEPELFWGVTAGSVDSMVANYTALKKKRRQDDFTPGGENSRRPDRASMAYTNLIRRCFKNTVPIVLGGLEASLRRIAHYDYWDDKVRKSILFDAKADILVYGMGEKAVLELAQKLKNKGDFRDIRGLCYIERENELLNKKDYITLPSFEEASENKDKFIEMFHLFYQNNEAFSAKGLIQKHLDRFLVQNPPAIPLSPKEIDEIYLLSYERDAHPYYKKQGEIRALETSVFSLTTHRGCFGECNFCSIAVHQGRRIISRSEDSILKEARGMIKHPLFKGIIFDVGGPTANMFGMSCTLHKNGRVCLEKRCVYPKVCGNLQASHQKQIGLLQKLRGLKLPNEKPVRVFVASGVRYDLLQSDKECGMKYLKELVQFHVSGQMKIAPEHSEGSVLQRMGKSGRKELTGFKDEFYRQNLAAGKKQFLTYYFIAAHPGCTVKDMEKLKDFTRKELHLNPEQIQIFTPTPSTYSTLMYYTEKDPFTGESIFVEKTHKGKEEQKSLVINSKVV